MILTKQGVRNLDAMYPTKPKEAIELPFNCGHYNMRKESCGNCKVPLPICLPNLWI